MKTIQITIIAITMAISPQILKGQDIQPPKPHISGVIDGHEYADLGLPSGTLWAICNLGASSPSDTGDFFAWGETEIKDYYVWETYKFFDKFIDDIYWGSYATCHNIGTDICGTEYDAARVHWGDAWRMPNYDEIKELRRNCWWKLVTEDGVLGYRFYGPNENSIFMPIAGSMFEDALTDTYVGIYWCGTERFRNRGPEDANFEASVFDFDTGGVNVTPTVSKFIGHTIRPVVKRTDTGFESVTSNSDVYITYDNGRITIHSDRPVKALDLWNMNGSKIVSTINPGETISGLDLPAGVYIAKLLGENQIVKTQKITIN